MAQLDRFLSALTEYKAEALILEQDSVPIFRFLSGNKSVSQTRLGADDVLGLIGELVSPETVQGFKDEGTASFLYTLDSVTYSGILEEDSERIVASIWEATEALTQAAQDADPGDPAGENGIATSPTDTGTGEKEIHGLDGEDAGDSAGGSTLYESPVPHFAELQRERDREIQEDLREIDSWLKRMEDDHATDLYLQAGAPAWMRVDGNVQRSEDGEILSEDRLRKWVLALSASQGINKPFKEEQRIFLHAPGEGGRFKIHCHLEREGTMLDIRRLLDPLPSADELTIPPAVQDLVQRRSGLILFCGPRGGGKSTTAAAMLELANDQRQEKIMVMDHPLEYTHESRGCMFTHRLLNPFTANWRLLLENVQQSGAGIVMLGNLDSSGAFRVAMELCESGSLVMGILPASSPAFALQRMLKSILPEHRDAVTSMLARHLLAAVHQSLEPGKGDGPSVRWDLLCQDEMVAAALLEGDFEALEELSTPV